MNSPYDAKQMRLIGVVNGLPLWADLSDIPPEELDHRFLRLQTLTLEAFGAITGPNDVSDQEREHFNQMVLGRDRTIVEQKKVIDRLKDQISSQAHPYLVAGGQTVTVNDVITRKQEMGKLKSKLHNTREMLAANRKRWRSIEDELATTNRLLEIVRADKRIHEAGAAQVAKERSELRDAVRGMAMLATNRTLAGRSTLDCATAIKDDLMKVRAQLRLSQDELRRTKAGEYVDGTPVLVVDGEHLTPEVIRERTKLVKAQGEELEKADRARHHAENRVEILTDDVGRMDHELSEAGKLLDDVAKGSAEREAILCAVAEAFEPVRCWFDGDGERDVDLPTMVGEAVACLEEDRAEVIRQGNLIREMGGRAFRAGQELLRKETEIRAIQKGGGSLKNLRRELTDTQVRLEKLRGQYDGRGHELELAETKIRQLHQNVNLAHTDRRIYEQRSGLPRRPDLRINQDELIGPWASSVARDLQRWASDFTRVLNKECKEVGDGLQEAIRDLGVQ